MFLSDLKILDEGLHFLLPCIKEAQGDPSLDLVIFRGPNYSGDKNRTNDPCISVPEIVILERQPFTANSVTLLSRIVFCGYGLSDLLAAMNTDICMALT